MNKSKGKTTYTKTDDQLSQAVFLASLRPPKAYDLDFFRNWLRRPKMGNFPLLGPDHASWAAENSDDLLAIQRRESSKNNNFSSCALSSHPASTCEPEVIA
jgi:hypothetical protein